MPADRLNNNSLNKHSQQGGGVGAALGTWHLVLENRAGNATVKIITPRQGSPLIIVFDDMTMTCAQYEVFR